MPRTCTWLCVTGVLLGLLGPAPALYAQIPIPAGFPNAATTGYTGTLTSSPSITVTTPGTVLQNLRISGGVRVEASNVTIRNCEILGGLYGVHGSLGYTGTLIEDCVIDGQNTSGKGLLISNTTVRRCEVKRYEDCVFFGSNVTVEDSWLHSLHLTGTSHNDGCQTRGATNVLFKHNTIQALYRQQTSCFIMQADQSHISGVTIEDNFLSGGGYTIYLEDRGHGVGNVTIQNNTFEKDSYTYGRFALYTTSPTIVGNVFHTGEPIPENQGNAPPIANAGPDQSVIDADDNGVELVQLDGSGSTCSDGVITSYLWTEGGSYLGSGVAPVVALTVGAHTIELKVTADDGDTDTDAVTVSVLQPGVVVSTTAWQSFAITPQTGTFAFEFDATPAAAGMDGLVGVLNGTAADYDDLACIFRFYTTGHMDVRNGSAYAADVPAPYTPGTVYHVRMVVNVAMHTYSVCVTPAGGAEIALATGYAFRSEQSGVTVLDHWALVHESGAVAVDNVTVSAGGAVGPTADAGPDQTLTDDDGDGFALVVLDGTASTAPPSETLTQYVWTWNASMIGLDPISIAGLPIGVHTVTLEVTDSAGAKATDDVIITVLAGAQPGDADGDGDVDLDDFTALKSNFGMDTGATVSDGDFDGDGDVDLDDFTILKVNFGS